MIESASTDLLDIATITFDGESAPHSGFILPRQDSRDLSERELATFGAHQAGLLVTGALLRIAGVVVPERLEAALVWLQGEHPLLRAHIVAGGLRLMNRQPFVQRRARFVTEGTGPIPFRSVVDATPGAAERMLQAELHRPMENGVAPRLRFVLIRPSPDADTAEIVVTADHTILDARAAMIAISHVLQFMAEPSAVRPARGIDRPLPPSVDSTAPRSETSNRRYEPIMRLPLTGRGKPRGTASVVRLFDRDQTNRMKAAAAGHRTTMHGVLAASLLTAIHERFDLAEMTCLSSIDFRRRGSPKLARTTFGCFVDLLRTRHRVNVPFWPLARDVVRRLVGALNQNQLGASVIRVPGIRAFAAETLPMLTGRFRADGLVLTTAGETHLGTSFGALELTSVVPVVAQDRAGAGIFAIAFERFGALQLTISYAPHCLGDADAEAIADRASELLAELPD